jgi:hypothetical protein
MSNGKVLSTRAMLDRDPEFHSEIITGDDIQVDGYDAETNQQFQW